MEIGVVLLVVLAGILTSITAQKSFKRPTQLTAVPDTGFSCRGRPTGYYADMDAGCQSYHMCANNRKYSYLCPHLTLFHQKYMVCNHFVAVDCPSSAKHFDLNLKIGRKNEKAQQNRLEKVSKTKKKSKSTKISRVSKKNEFTRRILDISTPTENGDLSTLTNKPSKSGISHPFQAPSKSQPKKPFKIGGRGANKFSFKTSLTKDRLKLRPLVVRSRQNFDQRSFTIPAIPSTTPTPDTSIEDEVSGTFINPIQSVFSIPDILLPPSPLVRKKPTEEALPQFLIPPREGAIVIDGENQEIRTPLSLSRFSQFHSGFNTLRDVQLSSVRGNAAFFIPEGGLLPPLPSNSVEEDANDESQELTTMIFGKKKSQGLLLPVNPDCPRCHPAFLRPNQCNPCVIIK